MLLLLLCFLLQGVFAALGPWVIFAGVKLVYEEVRKTAIVRRENETSKSTLLIPAY